MSNRKKIPDPDMTSVFRGSIDKTLERINCVRIGRVESINVEEQSITATIQEKFEQRDTGRIEEYPLLVDVPVMVLQGGGAYIEFPIAAGDACLILFNDTNIDTWWTSGNVTPPATRRRHSLADGIAIVGINPQGSGVGLAGDGNVKIVNGSGFVDLNGEAKRLVTFDELNTALQSLVTYINGHTHSGVSTGGGTSGPPSAPGTLDISAAETQKVRTG